MSNRQIRADYRSGTAPISADKNAVAIQMFNEGMRLHQAGQLADAEARYKQVLALVPNAAEPHYAFGYLQQTQGRLEEAIRSYDRAGAIKPNYLDAFSNKGVALKDLGRFDEAAIALRKALTIDPKSVMVLSNLGVVVAAQGKVTEAIEIYERAIALKPDDFWSLGNLAAAFENLTRYEEAIETSRKALSINPRFTPAHVNLALSMRELGRFDESAAALRQALAVDPTFAEAQFCLAQILLLQGDFKQGWDLYDGRSQLKEHSWAKKLDGIEGKPRWQGEEIAGKTILIYAEQGLGDSIQFVRYLPFLAERGAKVVFAVQPRLLGLLKDIDFATIVSLNDALPPYDLYCPLLSLPRLFGTDASNIPAEIPYFRANKKAQDQWQGKLGAEGFRIGIAWQGKPNVLIDKGRSFKLENFAPLAAIPGVRLISLQKDAGSEQLARLSNGMKVETLGADFDNGPTAFHDTAAVMKNLDLIITSDTSIAHLAGALGCPVWVALKHIPEWRWGLSGSQTPWYPTMQLFRQEKRGDWPSAFSQMACALETLVQERGDQ